MSKQFIKLESRMGKSQYIMCTFGQIFTCNIQDDRRLCHQISVVSRWIRPYVYTDFLPCCHNGPRTYES